MFTFFALLLCFACSCIEALSFVSNGSWSAMSTLKDLSDTWTDGKPSDGWWSAPIHANLLPSGNVLITGWDRQMFFNCSGLGGRRHGVTWVFDPVSFLENTPEVLYINPISEAPLHTGDVLYCAGHTPLRSGNVLFSGGAYYENLGTPLEKEYGVDYARIYSLQEKAMTRVNDPLPIGPSWYPTNARLPNGKILITGGLASFFPKQTNPGICLFDEDSYKKSAYPWILLANRTQVDAMLGADAYSPGLKDYSRIWILAEPVTTVSTPGRPPLLRQAALMGYKGTTYLLNTDVNTPLQDRFTMPTNGQRPPDPNGGAAGVAWDSTAAIAGTGELVTMGGNSASTQQAQRVDLYNPTTDSWRSFVLGRPRATPSSVLLPDGTILFINGENALIDQDLALNFTPSASDPRVPQIFDPYTGEYVDLQPEPTPTPFRGYHNMAILLKDGRVLTGGGVFKWGAVGCEHPTLRVFTPPYLLNPNDARPQWTANTSSSQPYYIPVSGRPMIPATNPMGVRKVRGVALMALAAFTHAFGQNQRYIPLEIIAQSATVLQVAMPGSANAVIPGEYMMYLISEGGTPSVGLYTMVLTGGDYATVLLQQQQQQQLQQQQNGSSGDADGSGEQAYKIAVGVVSGVAGVSISVVIYLIFKMRAMRATPTMEQHAL